MLDGQVKVIFDGGTVQNEVIIDYKMMKQVNIKSPSPLAFTIHAKDMRNGEMVNVNGSNGIVIDPSRKKQDMFVLFIGATGMLYFADLVFNYLLIISIYIQIILLPEHHKSHEKQIHMYRFYLMI